MFVVDTNVLVYAADRGSDGHARCRDLVERWRQQPGAWYVSWGICYEFLRVVTHPRVFRTPWTTADAWAFVRALLDSPGLEVLVPTARHREVLDSILRDVPALAGNLLHDTTTAALMREHGVRRICTRDMDFHRFPFLEVVDPLTSEP
jgi:hypothetical protein